MWVLCNQRRDLLPCLRRLLILWNGEKGRKNPSAVGLKHLTSGDPSFAHPVCCNSSSCRMRHRWREQSACGMCMNASGNFARYKAMTVECIYLFGHMINPFWCRWINTIYLVWPRNAFGQENLLLVTYSVVAHLFAFHCNLITIIHVNFRIIDFCTYVLSMAKWFPCNLN